MRVRYIVSAPRISLGEVTATPGPTAHVNGFVAGLRACGHDVEVLATSGLPGLGRVRLLGDGQLRGGLHRLLAQDVARIAVALYAMVLCWWRPRTPCDLVYERFATFFSLGRIWQRRGAVWVVECNGLFSREAVAERRGLALGRLARWHERRTLSRADAIVVVSHALGNELVRELAIDRSAIIVVPNGIAPDEFRPAVPDHRPRSVVGFVGQLLEWQGIDDLLAALLELPPEVTAKIVGDGADRPRLDELVRRLGLAGRVTFTGHLPRSLCLAEMRTFACGFAGHRTTELGEHYHSPLKVFEYAAMGLPVVATPSDAQRELSDRCPIFVYQPGDTRALAARIGEALGESRSTSSISEAALGMASWELRAQQFTTELTAVIGRRR